MQVGSETPMMYHCIIHQEALCCHILSLKDVTHIVISTVDYIRCNGLTHHQFQDFLDEMKMQHDNVYYLAIRWLSRGTVLKKLFSFMI
jgi:hypothetical protein